jgi:hypothetical protein
MASYGTTAGVTALVPALNIGAATVPTTAQATAWLEEGYSRINRALQSAGYSTPVVSGADVYAEFSAINNLYAAAYCLRARGIETATGTEESRDVVWLSEFSERLADLVGSDLSLSGVSVVAAGTKKRTRIRTMQLRKVDGYSGAFEGDSIEYDNPSE